MHGLLRQAIVAEAAEVAVPEQGVDVETQFKEELIQILADVRLARNGGNAEPLLADSTQTPTKKRRTETARSQWPGVLFSWNRFSRHILCIL